MAGHGLRGASPGRCSQGASERLGRAIAAASRGGASDASHFAETIPLTVDGLGPRGGGAHTPEEFVLADALRQRAEVALAVAEEVLGAVRPDLRACHPLSREHSRAQLRLAPPVVAAPRSRGSACCWPSSP